MLVRARVHLMLQTARRCIYVTTGVAKKKKKKRDNKETPNSEQNIHI